MQVIEVMTHGAAYCYHRNRITFVIFCSTAGFVCVTTRLSQLSVVLPIYADSFDHFIIIAVMRDAAAGDDENS